MKNLLFLLFLFTLPVPAQNESLFEEGNSAYNEGDYETAINNYEKIIENGETSADLYYNLANSYYKINNLAPSIYYYEKALQLDPNDRDIKNNLAIAQNLVVDDVSAQESSGLIGIWQNSISILGFNGWAWAAVIFSFLFAGLFVVYYFSNKTMLKRILFSFSVVCIFLAFFSLIFAFQQKEQVSNNDYAIIFSPEAPVRDEPTLRSSESFYLHEGTKIKVIERYQDWIKFELPNGLQGWMDKSEVKFF